MTLLELTVALNHTRRQIAQLRRNGVPIDLLSRLQARENRLQHALLDLCAFSLLYSQPPGDA